MKAMKLLVASSALVLLAEAATARAGERPSSEGGDGDARAQVTSLMNRVQQARLEADAGFFETFLTGDYVGVHGDGATETKSQLVAAVKSGALRYDRYDMRELQVRAYGDAAVANTLVAVKASEANGKRSAGDFRTTWVWTRRGGGWQCAAFQATRVVP
jgi:hypothetical protein